MAKQQEPQPHKQVGGTWEPQKNPPAASDPGSPPVKVEEVKGDPFHDNLIKYPESLPDGWLMHLLGLLRGTIKLDVKRDMHFGYHCLGYALGRIDIHDSRKMHWGYGSQGQLAAADALNNHQDSDWFVVEKACRTLIEKCQEAKG